MTLPDQLDAGTRHSAAGDQPAGSASTSCASWARPRSSTDPEVGPPAGADLDPERCYLSWTITGEDRRGARADRRGRSCSSPRTALRSAGSRAKASLVPVTGRGCARSRPALAPRATGSRVRRASRPQRRQQVRPPPRPCPTGVRTASVPAARPAVARHGAGTLAAPSPSLPRPQCPDPG